MGLEICGPIEAKQQIRSKLFILFYANLQALGPLVFQRLSKDLVDIISTHAEISAHNLIQLAL